MKTLFVFNDNMAEEPICARLLCDERRGGVATTLGYVRSIMSTRRHGLGNFHRTRKRLAQPVVSWNVANSTRSIFNNDLLHGSSRDDPNSNVNGRSISIMTVVGHLQVVYLGKHTEMVGVPSRNFNTCDLFSRWTIT